MNFLNDLGINFSKEPKEVQEIRKMIAESESKREALIQALVEEENRILGKNAEEFKKIGEYVFNNYEHLKENGLADACKESYDLVKASEGELKDIAEKKDDIVKRYAQEIDILSKRLESFVPAQEEVNPNVNDPAGPAAQNGPVTFCPNCGAKNAEGAKFCGSCGAKIN